MASDGGRPPPSSAKSSALAAEWPHRHVSSTQFGTAFFLNRPDVALDRRVAPASRLPSARRQLSRLRRRNRRRCRLLRLPLPIARRCSAVVIIDGGMKMTSSDRSSTIPMSRVDARRSGKGACASPPVLHSVFPAHAARPRAPCSCWSLSHTGGFVIDADRSISRPDVRRATLS